MMIIIRIIYLTCLFVFPEHAFGIALVIIGIEWIRSAMLRSLIILMSKAMKKYVDENKMRRS